MNTLNQVDIDYLRPSRTLETILVSNGTSQKTFFIYNYEGYSFRVFKNHLTLINFLQEKAAEDHHFSTEKQLNHFLETVSLVMP
ncbi:MAG: hypothetical protein AB8B53_03615 [Flavobacteriales bacterium]